MMIEMCNTVVAQITMGRFLRSKDKTCLAELQVRQFSVTKLRTISTPSLIDQVRDPFMLEHDSYILSIEEPLRLAAHQKRWDDPRIRTACQEHEHRAC